MNAAEKFSRYARHDATCPLTGLPVLPGDKRCTCGLSTVALEINRKEAPVCTPGPRAVDVNECAAIAGAEYFYWRDDESGIAGAGAAANILCAINGFRAPWHPQPGAKPQRNYSQQAEAYGKLTTDFVAMKVAAVEVAMCFGYGPHLTPEQNRALGSLSAAIAKTDDKQ